jgi:hypothetical protein
VAGAIAGKRSEFTFEHEKRHSNVAFFCRPWMAGMPEMQEHFPAR